MNLVFTIAIGENYKKIADLTAPTMIAYADKIGAEFKCLTEQKVALTYPYWEKFIVGEFLESYEKVLFIDVDAIVRSDCPNLFELVPADEIGLYNEGLLTTEAEKAEHFSVMQKTFKEYDQPWPEAYDGRFYNSGIMVVPRSMKWLFVKPEHEMFDNFREQAYLNMMLIISNSVAKVFDIGYKFNRMYYVDPKVKEHRLKSYIVHYAGIQDLNSGIKCDLEAWGQQGNVKFQISNQ